MAKSPTRIQAEAMRDLERSARAAKVQAQREGDAAGAAYEQACENKYQRNAQRFEREGR